MRPCPACGNTFLEVDESGVATWCECGRLNCVECGQEVEHVDGVVRHELELKAPRCRLHRHEKAVARRSKFRVISGGSPRS